MYWFITGSFTHSVNSVTCCHIEFKCPNVSLQCTNRHKEDVRCTAALSVTQFPRLCSGVRLASLLLVSCGFCVVATAPVHRASTKLLKQLSWTQIHPHILTRCNTLEKQHWYRQPIRTKTTERYDSRPRHSNLGNLLQISLNEARVTWKPRVRTWAQSGWP